MLTTSIPSESEPTLNTITTRRQRLAWAMQKAGDQPERIALKLKVTPEEVERAIQEFESARALLSTEVRDMSTMYEYLTGISGAGKRIQAAQSATRFTGAYDADGNPIFAPDHQTAMEAIKTVRELGELTVPKAGGAAINIGINNAGRGDGGTGGQGRSFEAMVRLAEQKRKLELTDGSVATMDAEFVENKSSASDLDDDDEIELDDPDDAGLDEDDED